MLTLLMAGCSCLFFCMPPVEAGGQIGGVPPTSKKRVAKKDKAPAEIEFPSTP